MYYNTPDTHDLRQPEPVQQEPEAQANFSTAVAAYADVEESTEADWLEFGESSASLSLVAYDRFGDPTEEEQEAAGLPWCNR